jgi:hypothetical protein
LPLDGKKAIAITDFSTDRLISGLRQPISLNVVGFWTLLLEGKAHSRHDGKTAH